jgi:phosphohistidine phosphatase SixA
MCAPGGETARARSALISACATVAGAFADPAEDPHMNSARPFLSPTRRSLLLRSVLAVLVLGATLSFASFAQKPGTPETKKIGSRPRILLVTRHSEKDPAGDPRDPSLSAAGKERAEALAALLAPQTIDAAFSSEYKRASETAAIAVSHGKGPTVAPQTIKASEPDHLFAALDALKEGGTALVVGHSNTVPAVLAHYGVTLHDEKGNPVVNMPDDQYGSLFVVTLPPAGSNEAASLLALHYGK